MYFSPGWIGVKLSIILLPDGLVSLVHSDQLVPHVAGGVLGVALHTIKC